MPCVCNLPYGYVGDHPIGEHFFFQFHELCRSDYKCKWFGWIATFFFVPISRIAKRLHFINYIRCFFFKEKLLKKSHVPTLGRWKESFKYLVRIGTKNEFYVCVPVCGSPYRYRGIWSIFKHENFYLFFVVCVHRVTFLGCVK